MNKLIDTLPAQLQSDLSHIQSRVADHIARHHPADNTFNPVLWARQALEMLEGWLLDEEQRGLLQLNPWDVFLLYASAHLCGIGMAEDAGSSPTASPYPHSRQLILSHWKTLGIRDATVAAAIADICGAMACEKMGEASTMQAVHLFDGVAVNGLLLTAALRLAKELDPHSPTTTAAVLNHLPAGSTISRDHYHKAFTVTGTAPHPYLSGTIQIKIQCRDPEIHRALKHHERTIQRHLQDINRHASPRFLYSDVIFEIDAQGYTPVDLKFSVDTSAALQLLTGNRLYSDNRVFLRELIQNAVDACNLRKRFEPHYDPSIAIRFNKDISVVTIQDNGIGMDRQWIEKYFLTIGISLYQSSEIRSASQRSRIDFNFISQFGIGFLSSFLVAEKIVIKTRKDGGAGLMITISNLKDYFDVRETAPEFTTGTEVTLHLKPSKINYCRSLEYAGYLKTNLRFLNVPVTFQDEEGQISVLGNAPLSYENPKTADIDFVEPLNLNHSQGYLLLRAKKNVDHIFTMESAKGGVSIFQDGIFVTQIDTLLPEGARQHVIGRINLLGEEKCALSMDRNRIFWTDEQQHEIKRAIRMALARAATALVAAVEKENAHPNIHQSIINNVAIFFDHNEVDDAIHQHLCEPIRHVVEKRFRDFVRIHFAHTLREEGIPEADGYSQKWQQHIIETFRKN